jgi:hypothetical protein
MDNCNVTMTDLDLEIKVDPEDGIFKLKMSTEFSKEFFYGMFDQGIKPNDIALQIVHAFFMDLAHQIVNIKHIKEMAEEYRSYNVQTGDSNDQPQ